MSDAPGRPQTSSHHSARHEGAPMTNDGIQMTLVEISLAWGLAPERVTEMVMEGVLDPEGAGREDWRFNALHLRHAGIALRLQRDLGLNLPGVALVLQLLDELQFLRHQRPPGA